MPGVVVHGAGHYVRGEKRTAKRLLLAQLTGVGLLGLGLGGLALTGASRRVVTPLAMTTIVGAALFLVPFLADIYGSVSGKEPLGRPAFIPVLETSVGARAVYDPVFPQRFFVVETIDARVGAFRLSPSFWFSAGSPNTRARLEGAYRFRGPTPARTAPLRGSFTELSVAVTHHAYTANAFAVTTFEWLLLSRLDLRRIGPTLDGSFAEIGLGTGIAANHYQALGVTETTTLLLGRVAFGTYLGAGRGEAALVYDHRRDGIVGGARLPGLPVGFLGSGGVRAKYFFTEELGIAGEALFGAAYVGGLSLVIRQ